MFLNKVILIGNVCSDIKVSQLENGEKIVNFSLATNSKYKNKEGEIVENTQFHKLVAFSPISDNIEKFVSKGSKLYVEGPIEYKEYVDKNNIKKIFTEIKILSFKILSKTQKDLDN